MPKSDHLHLDFLCASRRKPTTSGPSVSLVVRTTTDTGGLGSCAPAFAASSSRAVWRGPRGVGPGRVGVTGEDRGVLVHRGEGASEGPARRTTILLEDHSLSVGKV